MSLLDNCADAVLLATVASWCLIRYGHGVLRNPDPRFIALQEFCDTRPALLADPVIQLVKKVRYVSSPHVRITLYTH